MQPYPNPNYYTQYQNYQNYQSPYQQQYPYNQVNQVQTPTISGRSVNNVSEILANDVPMDGSIAVFPKKDMSEIYCKQWNANGTISTTVYKQVMTDETEKEVNKIDDIISRLERIEKNLKPDPKKKGAVETE